MAEFREDIFVKIKDYLSIEKILIDLTFSNAQLLVKGPSEDSHLFSLKPYLWKDSVLFCSSLEWKKLSLGEKLVGQFFLGGEKYYLQFLCTSREENEIQMKLDSALYRLQRREDFRVRLPAKFKAQFQIDHWNEKVMKVFCSIVDFSAGGLRFEISEVHLHAFEIIPERSHILMGKLMIKDKTPIALKAILRHLNPHPENPHLHWIGIQFIDIKEIEKNRLAALVMDIYRTLFLK